MRRYETKIEIAVPPQAVFAYVSDLTRHHEWAANTIHIQAAADTGSGVGARFASRGRQLGIENPNQLTIVQADAPRRFAFESLGREGRFLHGFDLEPAGSGTRLTKSFEVQAVSFPLNLLAPLFVLVTPRGLRKDLRRIKARLEAAPL